MRCVRSVLLMADTVRQQQTQLDPLSVASLTQSDPMCVVTRVTCVQELLLIHTHLQVGMQQPMRTGSSGGWLTGRSVTQGRGPLQTCLWESGVLSEPASSLLLSAVSSVPHTTAAGHNYSCAFFATLCGGVHTACPAAAAFRKSPALLRLVIGE